MAGMNMARVIPIELVKGMSGKVCQHSDSSFAYNASTGNTFTQKRCNPYTGEQSEKQKANQKVFAARQAVVLQWLDDNRATYNEDGTVKTEATALWKEAMSLKKSMQKASINSVLYAYQELTTPYAILLPSEGGVVNSKASSSGSGNSNPGGDI